IGAAGAVPFDLADRAGRRRHRLARIGADAKAVAEAKAVAGKIEIVALDAGARTDVIGGHRGKSLRREIALAVELAAIEQHLREARKIAHRGHHSATAGFPARHVERIALDATVGWQRFCK